MYVCWISASFCRSIHWKNRRRTLHACVEKPISRFLWKKKEKIIDTTILLCTLYYMVAIKNRQRKNGKKPEFVTKDLVFASTYESCISNHFWIFKWTNYKRYKTKLLSFNLSKAAISMPEVNSTGRFSAFSMLLGNAFCLSIYAQKVLLTTALTSCIIKRWYIMVRKNLLLL